MKPAVLIYNPRARRRPTAAQVARLARILDAGGWECESMATAGPGDATNLARRAVESGVAAVFVHGGDGTLREAAAGMLGRDTPLGFIPGGTANVMRLELGLPRGPEAAARAQASARPRAWDVGLCNGEPFLMLTSAGLDAAIMAALGDSAKHWLGPAAVLSPGFRRWLSYDYPRIELLADGEPLEGSLVAVSNISRYGGPWPIQPDARPDDRRLDLLVFAGRGRLDSLGFARDLFLLRGRHTRRRDITLRRVERVRLLGPAEFPVEIDGDVLPLEPPLQIELAAERVQLLAVPPAD